MNTFNSKSIVRLYIFLALLLASLNFSMAQSVVKNHPDFENYRHFDTISLDFGVIYQKCSESKGKSSLNLDLKGYGTYTLDIRYNPILLENAEKFAIINSTKIPISKQNHSNQWEGWVAGSKQFCRLNIYPNAISGVIETDSGLIFIETKQYNERTFLLIYKDSELKQGPHPLKCGENTDQILNKKSHNANGFTTYETFSCHITKIASVASYYLFKSNGYDTLKTFNEIMDAVNLSDGIYAKYIGIRLKISSLGISLDSLIEYNYSTGTDVRIVSFSKHLRKFKGNITPDLYHLFMESYTASDGASGRGLLGSTCDSNSVSVSMDDNNISRKVLVICHEIGHNFNANHGDGSNCGQTNGTIMCPTGGSILVFNSTETFVIKTYINNKLKNTQLKTCLSYPVDITPINLCDKDSAILSFKRLGDYSMRVYFENEFILSSNSDIHLPIKKAGKYSVTYQTDTLNSLSCTAAKDVYIAQRYFKVTNSLESGAGSLRYAILNANTCKGNDTITFELPEKRNTITLQKILPPIIEDCVIDATTQNGYEKPSKTKVYKPAVRIVSNLPTNLYSKHALLFGRNRYSVKGLEMVGFEQGITNDLYRFNNSEYSDLAPSIEGNPFMEAKVFACKFIGNDRGIFLTMGDTTKNNELVEIGDGTLENANFFLSSKSNGCRVTYTEIVRINGNYFGVEPMIDTVNVNQLGPGVNSCASTEILNNFISNCVYESITVIYSAGIVQNNTIGMNPFNGNITGYKGTGISCSGQSASKPIIIGGTEPGKGNSFYNQKKQNKYEAMILNYGSEGVLTVGNKSINPDTASIHLYSTKPATELSLDSVSMNCNTLQATIFGRFKPKTLNDTFTLHFYSTPAGVKKGYEPMHEYLGSKKIVVSDTNSIAFTHILNGRRLNEGVVFTASSHKLQFTSHLSNVGYPKPLNPIKLVDKNDTVLCPGKSLNLSFNTQLSDYKINEISTTSPTTISQPGFYNLTATDAQGCIRSQNLILKQHPNYLKSAYLSGRDIYSHDSVYTVKLMDFYDSKKWFVYKWSATNGFVEQTKKLETAAAFISNNATVAYEVTDVDKCSYSINKTLIHSVGTQTLKPNTVFKIYPNPTSNGIIQLWVQEKSNLQVFNSIGELIINLPNLSGDYQLDLSNNSQGIYYLRIGNAESVKIMVND